MISCAVLFHPVNEIPNIPPPAGLQSSRIPLQNFILSRIPPGKNA